MLPLRIPVSALLRLMRFFPSLLPSSYTFFYLLSITFFQNPNFCFSSAPAILPSSPRRILPPPPTPLLYESFPTLELVDPSTLKLSLLKRGVRFPLNFFAMRAGNSGAWWCFWLPRPAGTWAVTHLPGGQVFFSLRKGRRSSIVPLSFFFVLSFLPLHAPALFKGSAVSFFSSSNHFPPPLCPPAVAYAKS